MIPLKDDKSRVSTPVVKRQHIGEKFIGAIVRIEPRDRMKKVNDEWKPMLKENGKARQELVIHCLAMPGTTTVAGIGEKVGVPEPGDEVRLILNGKAFSQWIEARKTHRDGQIGVGDVIVQTVDVAQAYDAGGSARGPELTDQATIDRIPRGTSVGFYGPLELREPTDMDWVTKAEKAHNAATMIPAGAPLDEESPF